MSYRMQLAPILHRYFKTKVMMDRELNCIKSELCHCPTFNAVALFTSIDINNKSQLTINDLLAFLVEMGLNASIQEIQAMIRYFTPENSISIVNFVQGLIPTEVKHGVKGLSTPKEYLTQLLFAIVDQDQQMRTIAKATSSIQEEQFVLEYGGKKEFGPQDLIRLFAQFNEQLDGVAFQVVFGNKKSIPVATIKQTFIWSTMRRRQARLSECLFQRKKHIQRKGSINVALLSDNSTQNENPGQSHFMSKSIIFCKQVDMHPLDRETYLDN